MKTIQELKNIVAAYKSKHPMKDVMNNFLTVSLFWERRRPETEKKYPPLFTLKDKEHVVNGKEYVSLKRLYMSYDHVPGMEYEFAMDTFGDWLQWKEIAEKSAIRDIIQEWRDELDIRIKASAVKNLLQLSKDNLAASRAILAGEHKERQRGRPSKAEVEREKKIAAGVRDNLDADMERLGLKVIK
jgi:hypothetical protein